MCTRTERRNKSYDGSCTQCVCCLPVTTIVVIKNFITYLFRGTVSVPKEKDTVNETDTVEIVCGEGPYRGSVGPLVLISFLLYFKEKFCIHLSTYVSVRFSWV